jgi:uncharacterized Ntn-hydrolase superfamily protein
VTNPEPRIRFDSRATDPPAVPDALLDSLTPAQVQELERQVEYIVDDCFFTVGQIVGMRTTVDYEAVIWWRDHYREKFLAAMMAFGNRWQRDRSNVTSVAIMLAERAVRYSEGKASIDIESARQAAADVERHCELHARRAARRAGLDSTDAKATRIAGYWCTYP